MKSFPPKRVSRVERVHSKLPEAVGHLDVKNEVLPVLGRAVNDGQSRSEQRSTTMFQVLYALSTVAWGQGDQTQSHKSTVTLERYPLLSHYLAASLFCLAQTAKLRLQMIHMHGSSVSCVPPFVPYQGHGSCVDKKQRNWTYVVPQHLPRSICDARDIPHRPNGRPRASATLDLAHTPRRLS